uniref:Ig-like domain-containing protein n=1 Tax=Apteryx owenii TaxID=8824 RepID=A0A8B9SEW7_APTOW
RWAGGGCESFRSHLQKLSVCLLFLCVLPHFTAQLKVVGPDHPVTATVGQSIVLPCHLSPSLNAQSMAVRWIRRHNTETVHQYEDGEDLYVEQMREYQGRTELSHDGLSRGTLDLQIVSVRPSDDGTYVCTVEGAAGYAEATVELEVAAPFFHDAHAWKVALAVMMVAVLMLITDLILFSVHWFKTRGKILTGQGRNHLVAKGCFQRGEAAMEVEALTHLC